MMNKKRLLCLISNMNVGGAETYLMKLYRQLDKTKYQMDFCINVPNKCFYEDEINELGGKVYRITSKSDSIMKFKKQLSNLIKEKNYKYVLKISSNSFGFMDMKIAFKSGANVCAVRSSNSSDGDALFLKFINVLGRIIYGKYVNVKIAPSDLAARYTFGSRAYERGAINILHNAIDLDICKYDLNERNRIRDELKISSDTVVLGHIGRFMSQKNHMFLLDVFYEYEKNNDNSVLILVGEGELKNQVTYRVNELGLSGKVIFTGVRSDVPALLSAMDFFVFPSLYEGMPNSVIEAQATGLQCIVSSTITKEAKITEIVHYLPLSSASEWAKYINTLTPIQRYTRARQFEMAGYDINSVTEQFVKLIYEK